MKIAIVTHNTIKNDGQGKVNYELVQYLANNGNEVHIYTNRVEKELRLIKNVVIHYVPVFRESPNLLKSTGFFIFATLKLMRKHKEYDIIHLNGAVCFAPHSINTCHFCHAGWQAVGIEKGFYYKLHTLINILVEKIIYKKYKNAKIIALSKKIKNELTNIIGIDKKRIEVLYNGVDIEEFNPTKKGKSLRKSLGIEDDDFVILFLGDLRTKRKGAQYLIEAFQKINLPGIKLLLVGGSRGTTWHIPIQNLQNNILTLGFVKDTVSLYMSADIFVFPTLYEACSLTVFEAMASGLPVITSRQAGSSEIIEDKKDGIILKNPRDSEEIKEKIELLYNDKFLRSEIGKNAREKVKNYTWDKMNQKIEKIYQGVVANPL